MSAPGCRAISPKCETAPSARRRQVPDGAKCQTAPSARRRQVPNGARCRTAQRRKDASAQRGASELRHERVQHLDDRDQPVVQGPVHLLVDSLCFEIRSQVANRFLCFSARDDQSSVSIRLRAAAKRLSDVGMHRLRRFAELCLVNQRSAFGIRQSIYGRGDLFRRVEHGEIAMYCHSANLSAFSSRHAITSIRPQ